MHIGHNRLAIQWEVVKPGMVEMETEIETDIATATLRSALQVNDSTKCGLYYSNALTMHE